MKFVINRNLFLENLNNVMRAISSRTTIPILTGIKLDLSEEELVLTGSDTDISIQIKLAASEDLQISTTGSIVLPARFFSEIVKKLPGKDFSFEVTENFQTLIKSENAEFTINGLDANNYPRLPEVQNDDSFTLDSKVISELINQTTFAVAIQESRPILTGVHFAFAAGKLKAVATDSHRLAQREIELTDGPTGEMNLIIPGKSLTELSRIIGETSTKISVKSSENQILFVIGNISFYSRLLEGHYPDTDRLLPETSTTDVTFDIATLSSSLDRASLLTHESRNNVVKLSINPLNNTVVIKGNSPEIGNVEEEIAAKAMSGDELEISFNPDYLRDALRASITDQVLMKFTQPLRPFTVVPNQADLKFVQLITPVRTF
ncbi:DNA-directed DNA polymerase III beta subunit [Amylolactobacillus amylotrophicus DSM 20534]|uniref:Beta sliding clamp n=3 Tax=Amylolactobacillus TaxID=2767876 RepID=A0A0R1YX51_9LACO|nr:MULTISPECIES: DNA polymerase III subunit beta [Amylolactobacillus]APT18502.1 DNA polymerase III subunit beta [Amylolactobacillus amylophilus DSM 20533 = JCM 1125]KRK37563.1 DNA-directed DNA polymerase III beta subunit [Amylolactobacillus amylotrophicus DSM 20534]KRM43539.1 DNA-directed DNA polymerase III beta subunit [Amylolactobacillus amylophilus DSM 20533 = JCM 1125]GED80370.1 DNA polymerase III subunit beta [Amylolactobacillus amylophilus]